MNMTRKEATRILQNGSWWDCLPDDMSDADMNPLQDALDVALEALRPITREQVEKVWEGECDCSNPKACCTCCSMRCQYCIGQSEYKQATFCMKCGRPLTNKAVNMVMERLEASHEQKV